MPSSNFLRHWTGVLVLDSPVRARDLTKAQLFEQYVPFPYPTAVYEAPEIDASLDGTLRLWASIVTAYRSDKPGTVIPSLEVDFRLAADAYDGFAAWSIGTINARYVKARFIIDTSLGTPYVKSFIPTLDAQEHSENFSGIAIAAGGTAINFGTTFFSTPVVTFENDGSTPLLPTVTGLTNTGFTGHLYNTSGTQVGGTGKYTATGV